MGAFTGGLVRPDVPPELARTLAQEQFGVSGEVRELGSQQDRNYAVGDRYVLKVANAAFADAELDAQDAALLHLADRVPGLDVPVPQPARSGGFVARAGGLRARLLTYVPGTPLASWDHLAPVVVGRLGTVAGQVAAGLADLEHPGLDRVLQWDLRQARAVCEQLAPWVPDPARRDRLLRAAGAACDRLDALAGQLPVQPVHGDVTDDNVVCRRATDGRAVPTGVIDLGDVALGWVVGDLAATCASVLHHDPEHPLAVLPAVRAYAGQRPLAEAEVAALWHGVVARAAVLVVSGLQQGAIDPDNAYALGAQEREWQMFTAAAALPAPVAEAALRDALGLPARRRVVAPGAALLPDLPADLRVPDLSVTSDLLVDGGWLAPGAEQAVAGGGPALARWGEPRLTRTRLHARTAPATVPLGVRLSGVAGARVQAPFDGVLEGGRLAGDGLDLLLDGLAGPGAGPVRAGDPLGTVGPDGTLHVQACTVPGLRPPAFARPAEADAWRAVCPDPSPLLGPALGLAPADDEPADQLLARRGAALAAVQEHYYDVPPRIERGWRQHLVDTGARTYLDAVNNVAGCGHAHPRITAAAARQWGLLNTNSRFHYRALADFSERLAGLFPDPLDTVLLVNSGSEAVDLALRLARTATGRADVLCVAEAYHGWTLASDAVSTSVADNPRALGTRPDWVHPLPAPNDYRGTFRGPGAGPRYVADAVRRIDGLVAAGRPPAGFLCETLLGNAGGIALPDGYLAGVYDATRAAGGLCLADEVQVGYGRLGSAFWGFEEQGVVPDVVTTAKAMGNGHPLGAVVTTRALAEAFAADGYFFSSPGGSPVCCAVGSAVLDVLEDEGLQANAAVVGAHLRARFEALAERFPLVGAVHGRGLYLGVELVRDRATLEPATEETAALCERLLDLGVVLQPTGDRLNVLKVKPPLCLTVESADFLADAVGHVLATGW